MADNLYPSSTAGLGYLQSKGQGSCVVVQGWNDGGYSFFVPLISCTWSTLNQHRFPDQQVLEQFDWDLNLQIQEIPIHLQSVFFHLQIICCQEQPGSLSAYPKDRSFSSAESFEWSVPAIEQLFAVWHRLYKPLILIVIRFFCPAGLSIVLWLPPDFLGFFFKDQQCCSFCQCFFFTGKIFFEG